MIRNMTGADLARSAELAALRQELAEARRELGQALMAARLYAGKLAALHKERDEALHGEYRKNADAFVADEATDHWRHGERVRILRDKP